MDRKDIEILINAHEIFELRRMIATEPGYDTEYDGCPRRNETCARRDSDQPRDST